MDRFCGIRLVEDEYVVLVKDKNTKMSNRDIDSKSATNFKTMFQSFLRMEDAV